MSEEFVNESRRKFLLGATSVVGGAGVIGATVPFVASWQPSAKAKAAGAPVRVNISKLEYGARLVVEWRGKPVYIVRRTPESIASIQAISDSVLRDPESLEAKQPAYIRWFRQNNCRQRRIFNSCGLMYSPRLCSYFPTRCRRLRFGWRVLVRWIFLSMSWIEV